jgi:hypothetical protein
MQRNHPRIHRLSAYPPRNKKTEEQQNIEFEPQKFQVSEMSRPTFVQGQLKETIRVSTARNKKTEERLNIEYRTEEVALRDVFERPRRYRQLKLLLFCGFLIDLLLLKTNSTAHLFET